MEVSDYTGCGQSRACGWCKQMLQMAMGKQSAFAGGSGGFHWLLELADSIGCENGSILLAAATGGIYWLLERAFKRTLKWV